MKNRPILFRYLALMGVLLVGMAAQAQTFIRYKLERDAAGTYRVYMSSTQSFTSATMGTAQVTLLVPAGTLPEIPQGTGAINTLGVWSANSRVPAAQIASGTIGGLPVAVPAGMDFLSVGMQTPGVVIPGGIVAGQDYLLFAFNTSAANCPAQVRLWNSTDPDELSLTTSGMVGVANQMSLFAQGPQTTSFNAWLSNYGASPVPCLAADLISQLGPAPPLTIGQTAQLPVSLTNIGTGPAGGPLFFTTTLPSSVSAPASFNSLNGWGCTTVAQVVSCSAAGPLAPSATTNFTIPITPLPGTAGQQPIFSGVVSTTLDGNSSNNNPAPLVGPVIQSAGQPDLISSLGPIPTLVAGQPAQIPVTVSNVGAAPASGPIVYTTTLPAGLSAPATFNSLNGWGCTTVGQVVSCTNAGPLGPGGSIPFTIPVTVAAGTAGQQPSFSGGVTSPTTDANPLNNSSAPIVVVIQAPATSCNLVDCGTGVRYGIRLDPDGITYRVYMLSQNSYSGGNARIVTAQATIKLPNGMQIGNVTSYNNTTWSMNARVNAPTENPTRDYVSFGYSQAGTTAAFNIPPNTEIQLFSFQRLNVTCLGEVSLWASYNPALEPFQGVSANNNPGNQMTLFGDNINNPGGPYVNAWNCNYTCPVQCPAVQLSLVKQAPATVTQNVPFTYTMSVINGGTGPTTGLLTVTDVLPSGLQFVSGGGSGWTCSAIGQTVTCTSNGTISASATSSFPLQVNPISLANISNSATISGGGSTTMGNSAPCVGCPAGPTVTPVSPGASDLAIVLSVGGPLAAGQANVLNVQLTNTLASLANGPLSLSVNLPSGISAPATFALSGGWSCNTTATLAGNTVVCQNASGLAGSSSVVLQLPITPSASLIGNPVLITGALAAVANETNLTNNTNFVISSVIGADLSVSLGTFPVYVANTSSFVPVIITNLGAVSAPGTLTVNVTLPAGVSFNGLSPLPSGWSVGGINGQMVTLLFANPGGLAPNGGNVTINVPVLVGPSPGSSLPFIVMVVPIAAENYTINNTTSGNGTVAGGPDLSITVSGPTPSFVVNQPSQVQFTVTNVGSQSASGPFSVWAAFPAGYVVNPAGLPAGWSVGGINSQPTGTTLTLNNNAAGLLPLGTLSFNLTATPPINSSGVLGVITAYVNPATGETYLLNNSGSLSATPNAPGIGGTLTLPGTFTVGQPGQVTILLTNNGGSAYSGSLTTVLVLPNGVTPGTLPNGWAYGTPVNNGNGTTSYPITNGSVSLLPGGNTSLLILLTPPPTYVQPTLTVQLITPSIPGVPTTNITIIQVAPVVQPALPNVVVILSSPQPQFGVGQPTTINITLINSGNGAVSGPTNLTITLPTGMSLLANQLPVGWAILSTNTTPGGIIYVLTNPTLPIGANGGNTTISFPILIGQSAAGTSPTITVVVLPAPQPTPSSGILLLTQIGAPQMVVSIGQPTPGLVINQQSSLPVSFSNTGNGTAYGPLTLNVVLPNGVNYVPGAQVLPLGWTYSGSALQGSQTVLIFSNPNAAGFAPGSSVQFNVPVMPTSGAGTTPSFTVFLSPVTGQLTGPSLTIVAFPAIQSAASPDLVIVAYQPVPGLTVGQSSSLSVVIGNQGGAATSGGVSFQISLPNGLNINTAALPAGWFVSNTQAVVGGTTYTLTNSGLIIGANSQVGLSLQVTPQASLAGAFIQLGLYVNGAVGETVLSNNGFTLVITGAVQGAATPDLAVTIPAGQTVALAVGQTSLLSFNVSNLGGAVAAGASTLGPLSLTFAMPTGFSTNPTTFASGGWTCSTNSNFVSCFNASGLGLNASSAITIPVLPTGAAAGVQNPSFLISVGAASGETVLTNNVGIINILGAVSGPDLAVTFPAQSFTLVGGQTSNMLIDVQNVNGLAPAPGPLSLTFAMPAGFFTTNPASFLTNGWTCNVSGSNVVCTYPFGLAQGASSQLTIPLQPLASAGGVVLNPGFVASVGLVAGEVNGINNVAQLQYLGLVQVGTIQLAVKALLMGAYDNSTGLMRDALRTGNYLPLTNPYLTTTGNPLFAFPTATASLATSASVLAVSGSNAIVDWVVVELRSATNSGLMVSSIPALIQRDGDIVMASDGVSPLTFAGVAAGQYYVVVRHRNHLGAMSVTPVTLGATLASYDFTLPGTAWVKGGAFGTHPTYVSPAFRAMLWAGNTSGDAQVIFQGPFSDVDPVITSVLAAQGGNPIANYILWGYRMTDTNLDGQTIFQGLGNEPDLIFFTVMNHPGNGTQLANYIVHQHLP